MKRASGKCQVCFVQKSPRFQGWNGSCSAMPTAAPAAAAPSPTPVTNKPGERLSLFERAFPFLGHYDVTPLNDTALSDALACTV